MGSDFGIYIAQNQRTFENQGLIIEVKNISALIDDWENHNVLWEVFKQTEDLATDECNSFHTVNS